MSLRINPGTKPFHTTETPTSQPSVRPLAQTDTLASYTKAEQHGCVGTLASCVQTLFTKICGGVTWLIGTICGCCSPKVDGTKADPSSLIKKTESQEVREKIKGPQHFNQKYHTVPDILEFLSVYNIEENIYLSLKTATPIGLFNYIVGIYEGGNWNENMLLLAQYVLDEIQSGKISSDILKFERETVKPLQDPFTDRIHLFLLHFVEEVLKREKVDVNILNALSQQDDHSLFRNAQFQHAVETLISPNITDGGLTSKEKERLTDWAQTNNQKLYQQILNTVGETK
jgi:hypothetical protein